MDKNPISDKDKENKRLPPELESDFFSVDEQKEIVRMVILDCQAGKKAMEQWNADRAKDIQMYEGQRPSVIEELSKKSWQADRNLGMTASVCDAYQATLLATCWNPEKIHLKATEENDVDHKEQLEKFVPWMVGESECNLFPQVDDFIHNRITQGTSYFKSRWKVWYEWVDRRIPKWSGGTPGKMLGKLIGREFKGYEIKTERVRFEKGILENIADVGDLIMPTYGGNIQDKPWLIHVLHKTGDDIIEDGKRGVFQNVNDEYVKKLKQSCFKDIDKLIGQEKAAELGLAKEEDMTLADLRVFPVDLLEWYGMYDKNNRKERYRFVIDPQTQTFHSGKPLRKIKRTGKYPFVGGGLIRRPGLLQGKSLPWLVKDPTNALNNVFNQKSDFQYVENCPWFVFNPDEQHKKQEIELVPGKGVPSGDPQSVQFQNGQRSMAWAESDINFLLEVIERATGAASYFMSNSKGVSGTATRDAIINEKAETRFSLWVDRIQADIAEGINMLLLDYQDWAPPDLGSRVIGEDGKRLFPNLSIETLRGNYSVYLTPDIVSGSKAYEKEVAMWALEVLGQSVWFNPQINPKGNWHLCVNAAKKMGLDNIKTLMPPEPKSMWSEMQTVKDKFTRIKQGEILAVEAGDNIQALFNGFSQLREEAYHDIDPEYRANFDNYYFALFIAMQEEIQKAQQEYVANSMAMEMIQKDRMGNDPRRTTGAPAVQRPV